MYKNRILALYPNVEDHQHVVDAFADSHNEVTCVTCVVEAVRFLLTYTFTVIMLDSKLIVSEGESVTVTLKTVTQIPIIVVSTLIYQSGKERKNINNVIHNDDFYRHQPTMPEHHSAKIVYHHILFFRNELTIDPNKREVLLKGIDLCLTKIEFDILYFLAKHKGRVMSRDQIYANVWTHDASFDIDELVKAHIKRLRKKLIFSEHEYIKNVRGVGYFVCRG